MVSPLNLTLLAGGALIAFLLIKNAGRIGGFIGGGLGTFGNSILEGIGSIGSGISDVFTNTSEEQIVGSLDLGRFTTDVPKGGGFGEVTPTEIGRLTFAQFLKDRGLDATINISTGVFTNPFTSQPLDFTISPISGDIMTGRIGLSDHVLSLQAQLSKEFGIPTFDIEGNLSTFAGQVTGKTV